MPSATLSLGAVYRRITALSSELRKTARPGTRGDAQSLAGALPLAQPDHRLASGSSTALKNQTDFPARPLSGVANRFWTRSIETGADSRGGRSEPSYRFCQLAGRGPGRRPRSELGRLLTKHTSPRSIRRTLGCGARGDERPVGGAGGRERDSGRRRGPRRCCMKDLLRVGRYGSPFPSPKEPHCRDAVEGSSHV